MVALLLALVVAVAGDACPPGAPCLYKCCPPHSLWDSKAADCKRSDDPLLADFEVALIRTYSPPNSSAARKGSGHFRFLYGAPCDCRFERTPWMVDTDDFEITDEGEAVFPAFDLTLNHSEFCAEVGEGGHLTVQECFPSCSPEEDEMDLLPVGMMLSEPFLLATALVYCVLPDLRNLHGLCLVGYVMGLFVAYLFLAVVQMSGGRVSHQFCVTAAFIIYFSFLASFFWLNVMCLDIFWTFSGFRPLRGSVKEREHKKFVLYSLYSWGCPLIMLTVALVMDLHPDIPNTYIKPGFGLDRCWFNERATPAGAPTLPYFYGPVGVLVVCNIILFIITAFKINKIKKETAMLKGADSKRHDDEDNKQRFSLYLKLFLVMGVNWIAEVISWAVGGPAYLWYITDIGNTLQGVLIFIIFVWKDRIRRLLMEKFFPNRVAASSASTTAQTSSTRASPSRNSTTRISQKKNSKGTNELIPMKTLVSDDSDVP